MVFSFLFLSFTDGYPFALQNLEPNVAGRGRQSPNADCRKSIRYRHNTRGLEPSIQCT